MKKILISLANSSVLWGVATTFAYYYALNSGIIANETIVRYSTGHPVEYATIAMFWIGVWDLGLKLFKSRSERRALKRGLLFPPKSSEKEPISRAPDYEKAIAKAREIRGDSPYLTRIANALDFLKLGGSPDDLDLELRRLADDAYDERDSEYGMTRAFIWAIPILGFLGTVLGITVALGSLDLTQIESTSEKLASGLKVAFDTTALALSLVFVLYFMQFLSRRQDAVVARLVSKMADAELKGRFYDERGAERGADALDPSSRVLLNALAETFEEYAARQTNAIAQSMEGVAAKFGDALDSRLVQGAGQWSQTLADAQRRFVEDSVRPALDETARRASRFDALEEKVGQEIEALRQTLRACADVVALEDRLAGSLEKLAQVAEFEKTLGNLSATVCMLNSKIADLNVSPTISIDEARRASKRSEALAAIRALDEVVKTPEPVKEPEREHEPKRDVSVAATTQVPEAFPVAEPTTYPLKPSIFDDSDELNLPEAPDLEALQAELEAEDASLLASAPQEAPVDSLAAVAGEEPGETPSKKRSRASSTSARSRALLGKKKRSA